MTAPPPTHLQPDSHDPTASEHVPVDGAIRFFKEAYRLLGR